jgi:hypothetical protein
MSIGAAAMAVAVLAKADGKRLIYAGAAFIALSGGAGDDLFARLERLATQQSPLPELRLSDAQWNEPRLAVRVRHLAGVSYLRHAPVRSLIG